MPFLRFSRDKRGYENTYLCHTFQKDGTSRLKVLYWFRSPPNVGIGRDALDPEAVRIIEQSNPGLTFDWEEILKAKPPPVVSDKASGRGSQRALTGRSRSGGVKEPRQSRIEVETKPEVEMNAPQGAPERTDGENSGATGNGGGPEAQAAQHLVLEVTSESELTRLRTEYLTLKARSKAKKNENEPSGLVGQIEQLNPDAWISVDEARERIASFDESLAILRKALGRPRRARRGGRNRRPRNSSSEEGGVRSVARGNEPSKAVEDKEPGQE